MQYLSFFHSNSGYVNAPQCYITRTLPICYYVILISFLNFSVNPSLKFQLLYILTLTQTVTFSEAKNAYLCSSINNSVKQLQEFSQHMYIIDSICASLTAHVHHWQHMYIIDSTCTSLTAHVHHWQHMYITDSTCTSLTAHVHHWQHMYITDPH
jgi:hypothetical protein